MNEKAGDRSPAFFASRIRASVGAALVAATLPFAWKCIIARKARLVRWGVFSNDVGGVAPLTGRHQPTTGCIRHFLVRLF